MKISLTLADFPMSVLEKFKKELAKYVDATVQVGGGDTVYVTFFADNVVRAQEGIIIADKYYFYSIKGGHDDVEIFDRDEA